MRMVSTGHCILPVKTAGYARPNALSKSSRALPRQLVLFIDEKDSRGRSTSGYFLPLVVACADAYYSKRDVILIYPSYHQFELRPIRLFLKFIKI